MALPGQSSHHVAVILFMATRVDTYFFLSVSFQENGSAAEAAEPADGDEATEEDDGDESSSGAPHNDQGARGCRVPNGHHEKRRWQREEILRKRQR